MNTARRSRFFQIAIICLAIFVSITARMAASVGEARPGTTPSQSKAAAESPVPQKKLAQRIERSIRPKSLKAHTALFLYAYFSTRSASTRYAATAQLALRHAPRLGVLPQSLPLILRV